MPKFLSVARASDLRPGEGKLIMVRDKPMALFNVDGKFYAINYICPHMGGPLGEGKVDGFVVSCPWHGWTFDVRTGLADHPGGHSVSAYEVLVEGDEVKIGWLKEPETP
ncbi:MAG: Rieske 2Fe-2S domain-containing protein [Acidobacteria bacterium]|nr:Rieske 2Fe-2S domain-containing protein [Acidobacteriota bacterium]